MMPRVKLIIFGLLMAFFAPSAIAEVKLVSKFGSNPGNLKMYKYVPSEMPANAPLIVVLHGCTQSAKSYARDTGFNQLSDEYKFYVVYAEQDRNNNPLKCFNWFSNDDSSRDNGEAASIAQMVNKMMQDYAVNKDNVFVTGVSAGGCMTANMMAAYPDVFAGGAVMAGIPYGCASNATEGMACMFLPKNQRPQIWGDYVRNASPEQAQDSYPILSVFHGNADDKVPSAYAIELMEQWTNVHAADTTPEISETFRGHAHTVYNDNHNRPVAEIYVLNGMGHGISVDPGDGHDQGGQQGKYAFDTGVWSSYYAAKFWGLIPEEE
jgi:poly(hydroxyalkanoate) depolymerase family esterase